MKHVIHVNRHVMAENRKKKVEKPPIVVKTYKSNNYCKTVAILDENGKTVATLAYQPEKPLSCGATVWLTADNVKILD